MRCAPSDSHLHKYLETHDVRRQCYRGGGGGQPGGVGLYDAAPHVTKLTSSDFPDSAATGGGAIWLVEFYAPWYAPVLTLTHTLTQPN